MWQPPITSSRSLFFSLPVRLKFNSFGNWLRRQEKRRFKVRYFENRGSASINWSSEEALLGQWLGQLSSTKFEYVIVFYWNIRDPSESDTVSIVIHTFVLLKNSTSWVGQAQVSHHNSLDGKYVLTQGRGHGILCGVHWERTYRRVQRLLYPSLVSWCRIHQFDRNQVYIGTWFRTRIYARNPRLWRTFARKRGVVYYLGVRCSFQLVPCSGRLQVQIDWTRLGSRPIKKDTVVANSSRKFMYF